MKLDSEFVLQNMGEETVLVPVGGAGKRFHGVIRLNSTAAFLVECLREGADEASLMEALDKEYEGTPEQFRCSIDNTLKSLREVGALLE
ncbi:MAG: PqqD family protein [Lachnospiraceae bacterium]|nr:PqqD family protein [Lachnospiraceae bacterium]